MIIPEQPKERLPQWIEEYIADAPEAEEGLWAWVSELHYGQVVTRAGGADELVAIKQRFDWTAMEQACTGYRRYDGKQGVEATHTVRQLYLGVVLKAYYDWSYDTTARRVRCDSLARWFVGYRLDEATFSAVTLWRFEAWLKEKHPQLLFGTTLHQSDEDFPEKRTAAQIGDTFALLSRAHEQSRTQLLRMTARRLLHALEQVTPVHHEQVTAALQDAALYGGAEEKPEWLLEKEARDALEERTALAAHSLLRLVQSVQATLPGSSDLLHLALTRWETFLYKVLTDEFVLVLDEEGACVQATLRPKHVKGSYVIGSAVDPEATFRRHGDRCDLGYNAGIAATTRFIRAVVTATGAAPDSTLVAPSIAVQLSELGLVPPKLIYDRAAGSPKTYAAVEKASHGQTQLVARLIDHAGASPLFGPQDCTLGEDGVLTCPAGCTTSRACRSQSGDGWNYRFSSEQCRECPLAARCRKPDARAASPRTFFINDYRHHQRKALAYLRTDAFQQDMRLRPAIERIIACLVRYHGARHAHGYGLANADYQAHMAAMAFNLKTWVKLINERRKLRRTRPEADTP